MIYDKASKITANAWYRANKFIKALASGATAGTGADAQADFVNKLKGLATGPLYVAAVQGALAAAGLDGSTFTGMTWDALAQTYATVGIPQEVWIGKLLYNPSGKKGTSAYTDALGRAKAARAVADDIRTVIRTVQQGLAMFDDILNTVPASAGNPGGVADATKGT